MRLDEYFTLSQWDHIYLFSPVSPALGNDPGKFSAAASKHVRVVSHSRHCADQAEQNGSKPNAQLRIVKPPAARTQSSTILSVFGFLHRINEVKYDLVNMDYNTSPL